MSAIYGKSIHHVHSFAAFFQTIENANEICKVYAERFKNFPLEKSNLDADYCRQIAEIFDELFLQFDANNDDVRLKFSISADVTRRAIDMTSGLLHQLDVFMNDTNAPVVANNAAASFSDTSGCKQHPSDITKCLKRTHATSKRKM